MVVDATLTKINMRHAESGMWQALPLYFSGGKCRQIRDVVVVDALMLR